jgi:hypothetical protein
MIPDVHPADALLDSRGDFSMSAGDFLECYSDDNNYGMAGDATLHLAEGGLEYCRESNEWLFEPIAVSGLGREKPTQKTVDEETV